MGARQKLFSRKKHAEKQLTLSSANRLALWSWLTDWPRGNKNKQNKTQLSGALRKEGDATPSAAHEQLTRSELNEKPRPEGPRLKRDDQLKGVIFFIEVYFHAPSSTCELPNVRPSPRERARAPRSRTMPSVLSNALMVMLQEPSQERISSTAEWRHAHTICASPSSSSSFPPLPFGLSLHVCL